MGRVKEYIIVNNQQLWALFDTGSRNTYVIKEVVKFFPRVRLEKAYEVRLGEKVHKLRETIILNARIEGKPITTHAFVIDEIGTDEKEREIQVLFGALAMQEWGD